MPIDFHAEKNRTLYATRAASPDWAQTIQTIARPEGLRVADIGCEGGIYAAEWTRLGAASVVGIDFSEAMLSAARERNHGLANVIFQQGDALATGLPDRSFDIVFERALIHHLDDLGACFAEAHRLLGAGGRLIIQGRTPDDVALPGSPDHLRGYIFACFPRLLAVEAGRRPRSQDVIASLASAGFSGIQARTMWETRQVYATFDAFAADIRGRIGRSILHELSDAELANLVDYIREQRSGDGPVIERDRWTLWWAAA